MVGRGVWLCAYAPLQSRSCLPPWLQLQLQLRDEDRHSMYVCVCMVCLYAMYVCMCVCMYVCMYVCMCMYGIHVCVCNMYVCWCRFIMAICPSDRPPMVCLGLVQWVLQAHMPSIQLRLSSPCPMFRLRSRQPGPLSIWGSPIIGITLSFDTYDPYGCPLWQIMLMFDVTLNPQVTPCIMFLLLIVPSQTL